MLLNYQQIIELCSKVNLIDTTSYSEKNVQGASYDLHLGELAYVSCSRNGRSRTKSLIKGENLEIPANSICMFQTKEKVKLPLNIAGKLSLRMGLVRKGLFMPSQTQADPGYNNYLFGMLYNLSNEPIIIQESEHVVSIEFFKLEKDTKKEYTAQYNNLVFEQFVKEHVTSSLDYLHLRLNDGLVRLKRTKKWINAISIYLALASLVLTFLLGYLSVSPYLNLREENKEIKQNLNAIDNKLDELKNSVILLDSLKINAAMQRKIDNLKLETDALKKEIIREKGNVLLIYCTDYGITRFGRLRTEFPPLGLLYLASSLQLHGYNVDVLNILDYQIDRRAYLHDFCGISINTGYDFSIFNNEYDKLKKCARILIAGGQFASTHPEIIIKTLNIKYIITGEGERSFPELLDSLIHKKSPANISGLIMSRKNKIITNPPVRISNLNEFPPPARNLLPLEKIILNHRVPPLDIKSIAMITSRGCPYNCYFCGNNYKEFYSLNPAKIEIEIDSLISSYEIKHFTFLDENILFDENHLFHICSIMKKKKLLWSANARVDSFSEAKIKTMSNSGCYEIKYGIESGDAKILHKMNKKINRDQIIEAIVKTKYYGVRTKAFLLYGFPGDNFESAKTTRDLLKFLHPNLDRINIFNFAPLPNSFCYKFPNKFDIHLTQDFSKYNIYKQFIHWWGNENDYKELLKGRELLVSYIKGINTDFIFEPIRKFS